MRPSLAVLACLCLLAVPGAQAAVRFSPWSPATIDDLLAEAAAQDRLVMVLITQPDWCPACIHLDRTLLRNPEATQIAELTRDWVILEVYGYDSPGAEFLEAQGLSFVGTPTTILLKPGPGARTLGGARRLVAFAGAPDDYAERLRRAAEGHDAIAEAQARVRAENDAEAWLGLARAYLEAGDAEAARRAYRSLLVRGDLDPEQRREIGLEAVIQPTQRVEKDHARALAELDAWVAANPGSADAPDLVYARAWSLLALDRIDEARAVIDRHYLAPDTADGLAQYLYLVFRHPSDTLLADAEARARAGVERFPEQRARLAAAHGRILRRQGRLDEALAAFESAVEAAGPEHPSYETYVGQREFVRSELAGADGRGG